MTDDAGGMFTIDFLAGHAMFVGLLAVVFYGAAGSASGHFTLSYAGELRPLAVQVSDRLVLGQGSPPDWHMSPATAANATSIGLSDGRPNMLSADKIYGLALFNDTELSRRLGLDDAGSCYGVRVEVRSDDGSISVASGFVLDADTADVCKCVRLVEIECGDGGEREGKLILNLWRRYAGTTGTGR